MRAHAHAPLFSPQPPADRKSTRLNSSHANISYAVFCLKKKKITLVHIRMIRDRTSYFFFFFNDTATTEIYTLSLHDALPIFHLLYDVVPPGRAHPGGTILRP